MSVSALALHLLLYPVTAAAASKLHLDGDEDGLCQATEVEGGGTTVRLLLFQLWICNTC